MPPHEPREGLVAVTLPAALVRLFPGSLQHLELSATTVAELIDELDRRWPGMRDRLCDPTPRIRPQINAFVAGRRASLSTTLSPGDTVVVLTAVIG